MLSVPISRAGRKAGGTRLFCCFLSCQWRDVFCKSIVFQIDSPLCRAVFLISLSRQHLAWQPSSYTLAAGLNVFARINFLPDGFRIDSIPAASRRNGDFLAGASEHEKTPPALLPYLHLRPKRASISNDFGSLTGDALSGREKNVNPFGLTKTSPTSMRDALRCRAEDVYQTVAINEKAGKKECVPQASGKTACIPARPQEA